MKRESLRASSLRIVCGLTVAVAAAAGALLQPQQAHGIVLGVDFHNSASSGSQGGAFETYTIGSGTQNGINPAPVVFGAVTVDVGTVSARDRALPTSTSPAGFERLIEDAIFNTSAGVVVTLDGLTAGRYRVTTYHHDADVSVFDVAISVTDAVGTNERRTVDTSTTNGSGANEEFRTLTFDFIADGTGDSFTVLPIGGPGAGWVNGFSIEAAPATPTVRANVGNSETKLVAGWEAQVTANAGDVNGVASISRHFIADFSSDPSGAILTSLTSTAGNFVSARSGRGSTDLIESLVFAAQGDLELLLNDLTAGTYELTTYHFDPNSSLTGTTNITVDLDNDGINDIFDTDADGINDASLLAFTGTVGTPSATYRFTLAADGIVAINFNGNDMLSAYELTALAPLQTAAVPEPTSAALCLLGAVGMLRRRRVG